MLEYKRKVDQENIRAENIKRKILQYSVVQNSINAAKNPKAKGNELNWGNLSSNLAGKKSKWRSFNLGCNGNLVNNLTTSVAIGHLAKLNSNLNVYQKRNSQEKKKKVMEFEDLFNLKQKLLGNNNNNSSNDLIRSMDANADSELLTRSPHRARRNK